MKISDKVKSIILPLVTIFTVVILLAWSFGEFWSLTDSALEHSAGNAEQSEFYEVISQLAISISWKFALALGITFASVGYMISRKGKAIRRQTAKLDAITGNIPGGVICTGNDECLSIVYMSDSFLKLVGYTRDEIELSFDNRFLRMIYPLDRMRTFAEVNSYGSGTIEVQYRLIRKDGVIIWILDKGQLITDKSGKSTYYCVLVDISDLKRAEQELVKSRHEAELANKRYAVLLEQSEDVIFDYDLLTKEITHSPNFREKFGYPPVRENFPNSVLEREMIHPDDIKNFKEFYERIHSGIRENRDEHRILTSAGHYVWCRVRATTIFNELGKPVKAVGRISDISGQREGAEWLAAKAQTDPLTGLLGASITQAFIEQAISTAPDKICALFLLDVDGFKAINEQFGKKYGDEVLMRLSELLQSLFRASDIVGRVGGDEFMILLKNCSPDFAQKKAKEICTSIEKLSAVDGYAFSGSVGAAMFPVDGDSFDMLGASADCALSEARKAKKNSFCFYENSKQKKDR